MAKLLLISLLFAGDAVKSDGVGVLLLEMAVLGMVVLETVVLDPEDRAGAVVEVTMLLEIIADVVLMADVATERFTVKLESGQTVV
jgi:uncharacterized membrane protein YqjE